MYAAAMLGTAEVIAFIATTRADEALAFYRDVLGLRVVEDTPYAIVMEGGGTMLRVQKAPAHTPAPHTALGWKVADLGATMDGLTARGVTFARFGGIPQDADGVWTTPDGTRIAWFRDPDGNLLSLTQF